MLEEGLADIPTIEEAGKRAFKIGMGPFELMNVTGIPIAVHAATTLGNELGPVLRPGRDPQGPDGEEGELGLWRARWTKSKLPALIDRFQGVCLGVAAALVDEGVASIEDTDRGAKIGLRWILGPFEIMNKIGIAKTYEVVQADLPQVPGFQDAGHPRKAAPAGQTLRVQLRRSRGQKRHRVRDPEPARGHERPERDRRGPARPAVRGSRGRCPRQGYRVPGRRQGLRGRRRHPLLRGEDQGRPHPGHRRVHPQGPRAAAAHRGVQEAHHRPARRPVPRRRQRAGAGLPGHRRHPGRLHGLSGNRHRHLSRGSGACCAWRAMWGRRSPSTSRSRAPSSAPRTPWRSASSRSWSTPRRWMPPSGPWPPRGKPDKYRTRDIPEKFKPFASPVRPGQRRDRFWRARSRPAPNAELAGKVVKTLGYKAPLALRIADEIVDQQAALPMREAVEIELGRLKDIFSTADALEVFSAGRRRPEFKGKSSMG
ncbi:MAG: 3-hydroxyacyl-CoA dehydrogenase family protein [Desulfobacterales bacterium]|nr:3-hydroxyacyl-CoA dehydrogenase family protein [Desulfobacterales bacterium]